MNSRALIEMALDRTKFFNTREDCDLLIVELTRLLPLVQTLPFNEKTKQAADDFARLIENEKVSRKLGNDEELKAATGYRLKTPIGQMASPRVLIQFLKRSSGFGDWTGGEVEDDDLPDMASLGDSYGFKVDATNSKTYTFTRSDVERSDLSFMKVTVFPGHVYVSLIGSDRVSDGELLFDNLDELASYIKKSW